MYLLPLDEQCRCLRDMSLPSGSQQDRTCHEHMAIQDLLSLLNTHNYNTSLQIQYLLEFPLHFALLKWE